MQVTIYQHSNYQGNSKSLSIGCYNIDNLGIGNDQLSSLAVPNGMEAILFSNDNFQGEKRSYTSNVSFVSDFNDTTSSIIIRYTNIRNYGSTPESVAKGMRTAGYSATEVANALKSTYNLGAQGVATALKGANYGIKEVGVGIQKVFQLTNEGVFKVFQVAGYGVTASSQWLKGAAGTVEEGFAKGATTVAQKLNPSNW